VIQFLDKDLLMPASSYNGHQSTTGHACDTVTGVNATSQSKVFIEGILGLVQGDPTAPHTILSGITCVPHSAVVNAGSSKVFYEGIPSARIGDSCDGGAMIQGSSKVFEGG
jgi:uncharacterized Zn-binding protein involved in type VI secretion